MAESTLALSYDDIRKRVGKERGFRTVIEDWTDDQQEEVEFCLRDGSSMFYTQANYEWSFLTPLQSLSIAATNAEIELPRDFNFLVDQEIYFSDNWGTTIKVMNDAMVLMKRQRDPTGTGRPLIAAAVVDGGPMLSEGQTWKLIFYPISDAAYTIRVRYSVMPNSLGPMNPFPYGGPAHSQTILEACLAASERLDGKPEMHNQLYAAALENSKALDRRLKPRTLGYNGNRQRYRGWFLEPTNVTYTPGNL